MHFDLADALLTVLLLWILTAPHEFAHAWVATRLGDDTPMLVSMISEFVDRHSAGAGASPDERAGTDSVVVG